MTLVGYSFGSRVIFSCLKELCRQLDDVDVCEEEENSTKNSAEDATNNLETSQKPPSVRFYIQDVVLLGSPINSNSKLWKYIRNIVSGRIINGYSSKDLVLGLIYRYVITPPYQKG